jgi:hypothetical protein
VGSATNATPEGRAANCGADECTEDDSLDESGSIILGQAQAPDQPAADAA